MKRFFKTFLFLILLGTSLYSQTADPFFFGMYVMAHDINYDNNYNIYHHKASNQDFMTFWKNNFQMNSQMVNIYPMWLAAIMRDTLVYPYKYDAFLKYFKGKNPGNGIVSSYGINSDIEGKKFFPIFEDEYISVLSESHYLKLDPADTETDMIVGTTPFIFDASNMKVINNYSSSRAGTLIGNINIQGSNNGLSIIIPRKSNITDNQARFKIRFKITADAPAYLNIKILNNPANPLYGTTSSSLHNYQPLNSTIYVTQAANQIFERSFYLDKDETYNNYLTAYNFAFQLLVTGTLASNKFVQFNEIAIYDDLGRQIVEDGNFDHFPDLTIDLNSFIDELIQTNGIPIVRLADEPVVGNFAPSKAVKNYMQQRAQNQGKAIYFYGVQPERSSFWEGDPESIKLAAKDMVKRFYTTVNVNYTGFDNYPFGYKSPGVPDDTINISPNADYVWNIYGEYYTALKNYKKSIRENNLGPKNLIAVPQIFSEPGRWRNPTKSEIISCSYLSMLLGYKGIIYYNAGLDGRTGYDGLYKSGPQVDVNMGLHVQSINDPTRIHLNKKIAVTKIGAFLNETVDIDNPAQKVGDLLAAASPNINENNNRILGRNADNTYDTDGIDEVINLGNETDFTLLERVAVVDPSTGALLTNQKNLFGVNWFTYSGKSYFLFANLNEDGHTFRLKLYFKSHKANLLKINTAPYSVLGKITYPASGCVFVDIPQDGAVLMQVENTNLGWHGFPRNETRFGVARTTNNITYLYLDKNYYTKAGVSEEVSINTGINAANIFPLYVVKEASTGQRYTDIVTYRVTGSVSMSRTIEYKIFRQNSTGVFSATPETYSKTITLPSTSAAIYPIAYDGNNDGNDEIGFVLAYNNHYYLYTYSTISATSASLKIQYPKETTVATAPEYYSTTAANVFGMSRLESGAWKSSLCVYKDAYFYMDMNADNILNINDANEKFAMWSSGHIPIIGDWANNDMHTSLPSEAFEYGLYGWDGFYGNSFKLNFGHNDGYGYFNFPYGDPGDKPVVWVPRVVNYAKSSSEVIEEAAEIPSEYSISQNFPNPFNPATTIRFALPAESRVTLEVFNILGERVAELVNDVRPAGTMDVRFDGSNLASGIYIYKFNATSLENGKHFQKINKMMLLK